MSLVDSTSVSVELFTQLEDNSWHLTEYKEHTATFHISTIKLTLCLQDIYDDVSFEE